MEADLITIMKTAKIIAVVGISAKPNRPSYGVAHYLQQHGYRIIPINPKEAGTYILGELCFPSLTDFVDTTGQDFDIVDCFRKSEDIPPIVDEAIKLKAKCIWMQLGIVNQVAQSKAEAAGIQVVMDKCLKIEHAKYMITP